MQVQLGLIGFPLSHSFSKGYFKEKFQREGLSAQYHYENYPLENIGQFPELVQRVAGLRGLNVTIPYKEQVIPFLNHLDDAAATVGAVNTILFKDGKSIGYNTDVIGFENSLTAFLEENGGPSRAALILGTGGASKAAAWVLHKKGVVYQHVTRTPSNPVHIAYTALDERQIAQCDLIINTTPVGMFPNTTQCPEIPYHCLNSQHRLYDMVYNPPETLFMQRAQAQGAAVCNGLAMLHGQAEAAWRIWTNA